MCRCAAGASAPAEDRPATKNWLVQATQIDGAVHGVQVKNDSATQRSGEQEQRQPGRDSPRRQRHGQRQGQAKDDVHPVERRGKVSAGPARLNAVGGAVR